MPVRSSRVRDSMRPNSSIRSANWIPSLLSAGPPCADSDATKFPSGVRCRTPGPVTTMCIVSAVCSLCTRNPLSVPCCGDCTSTGASFVPSSQTVDLSGSNVRLVHTAFPCAPVSRTLDPVATTRERISGAQRGSLSPQVSTSRCPVHSTTMRSSATTAAAGFFPAFAATFSSALPSAVGLSSLARFRSASVNARTISSTSACRCDFTVSPAIWRTCTSCSKCATKRCSRELRCGPSGRNTGTPSAPTFTAGSSASATASTGGAIGSAGLASGFIRWSSVARSHSTTVTCCTS